MTHPLRALRLLTSLLALSIPPSFASAATYYWDANGTTAGAGVTPSGTWGVDPYWTTDSTGVTPTAGIATTSLDDVNFSAGTDAIGSPTITVNGTQNARVLTVEDGSPTFSGGTINLTSSGGFISTSIGGITNVATTAGNPTISSNLSVTGGQSFNVATGKTLTLNTGTFTRQAGATLQVARENTVTSTMPNLRSADLASGIIGPWATVDVTSNTRYATINGSNQIVSYTGTAASPESMIDTTGTANYEISVGGTAPDGFSANTIRNSALSPILALGATSFTVNGLLSTNLGWNVGSTSVNPNTKVTIGSNRDLVVSNGGGSVAFNAGIQDNASGASGLTKMGASALILRGVNTFTGTTTVNQGSLELQQGASLPDTAALVLNAGTFQISSITATSETIGSLASRPGTTITLGNKNLTTGGNNASTTVASTITGVAGGSLTKQGTGTMTLTGASTYTGATIVNAGTLSANNTTGSATATGAVTIASGGTLAGTGAISGPTSIQAGGTLAPGNSIGTLTVGNLTLAPNGVFQPEVDLSLSLTPAADLLKVNGTISLAGSTLDVKFLNAVALGAPLKFLVMQNDGDGLTGDAITDTFGNILSPIGYAVSVDYNFFGPDALGRIGDGNDLAITISSNSITAVPEAPAWLGMGAIALCAAGVTAVRRKITTGKATS